MKKYVKQIRHILRSEGIESAYNRDEDAIYSLKESPFGDIYCIYLLKKDVISCFAIYEHKVSAESMGLVMLYLDEFNKLPGGGYFYIDITLTSVTYCVDYEISRGLVTPAFERFCLRGYELYELYRPILFRLITNSRENLANLIVEQSEN